MMQKSPGCIPAGETRQKTGSTKKIARLQLDCQLFTRTIYPEMQESACFMKDC